MENFAINESKPTPKPRELEILTHLAKGLSHKQIGATIFVSPRTVDTYVHTMKKKFNCFSTSHLVAMAFRLNWIE